MYKSSKVYNTMFGMYEDSPFNFFEEEEESSIFDVFEGGNDILDMFLASTGSATVFYSFLNTANGSVCEAFLAG